MSISNNNNSRYKIQSTELENKTTQCKQFFLKLHTFLVDYYSVSSNQARQKTGIFYENILQVYDLVNCIYLLVNTFCGDDWTNFRTQTK